MECKCVINDGKTGKSYQKAIAVDAFVGKKVGETMPGTIVGLTGYELKITGGSDYAGFPMRPEINMGGRKKMVLGKGDVGSRTKEKGLFLRKTVVGNIVGMQTAQLNMMITKHGTKSVEELLGIKPKEGEQKTEAVAT